MSHAKVPALRLGRARSGQADGSEPISPIATPTARSSRRTGRKRGREAGEDKGAAAEKRKVAERRRFLRDQRMETIHYPELIKRLKTLVEDHAPTDSEISELYQRDELRIMLKENGLSYHRKGDRESNQMQNKGEMARQLNHIIINGRFSTFKGAAGHPGVTKNKKAPPPSQKPVPKKEMPPPPKRRAPAAKPKPKPKAAKPKASPKAAKIMPVPTAKSPELVTPPMGPQRTSQAPPDFSLGAPVAVLPPQTAPVPVPVHDAPVRQTPRAPPVFLQAPRYPQPQPQPQPQPRPQPQPQLLRGPPAQSDATIPAAQPRGWNDNQELFVPPSVPSGVDISHERGDRSLGCPMARRGSFEILHVSHSAKCGAKCDVKCDVRAAHTLPKTSSLHNLALLEEAKSLESTDWTNVATEVGPCSVEAWCM